MVPILGIVICAHASFWAGKEDLLGDAANNSFVFMSFDFRKMQLAMWDPCLPELSPQGGELPGRADKEANDAIRRLRNRNHEAKNSSLFHEDVKEVRFVLNVKFGFWKILTFIITESTESFPLYTERPFTGLQVYYHHSASLHLPIRTKETFTACEYFNNMVLKGTLSLFYTLCFWSE